MESNHARHIYSLRDNQQKTGTIFKISSFVIPVLGVNDVINYTEPQFYLSGVHFISRPTFSYGVQMCDTAGDPFDAVGNVPQVTAGIKQYEISNGNFKSAIVKYTITNPSALVYKFDLNLIFMGYALP